VRLDVPSPKQKDNAKGLSPDLISPNQESLLRQRDEQDGRPVHLNAEPEKR
jgi:hypothetical protein